MEGKPGVYFPLRRPDYSRANNWSHELFDLTQDSNRPPHSVDDPQVGKSVRQFNDGTVAALPRSLLRLPRPAELNDIAGCWGAQSGKPAVKWRLPRLLSIGKKAVDALHNASGDPFRLPCKQV